MGCSFHRGGMRRTDSGQVNVFNKLRIHVAEAPGSMGSWESTDFGEEQAFVCVTELILLFGDLH